MKNKIVWHQIVLIGTLGALSAVKLLTGRMFIDVGLVWWWLGAILGFLIVFADRLVYVLLMKEGTLSAKFGEMFAGGKYAESVDALLKERYEQKEMVMRSVLFGFVWIVLALFTITSVNSFFGKGFLLGIGLHLVLDLINDFYDDKDRFNLWFWQIKRELMEKEKKMFVLLMVITFMFLGLVI